MTEPADVTAPADVTTPDGSRAPAGDAEFDVVVAGSGAAGMTAALTAAHLGLSVLVIEKTGFFGGSTRTAWPSPRPTIAG